MKKTEIEWCDYTSNPVRAVRSCNGKRGHFCTKLSRGCRRCYSENWNLRFGNGLKYTKVNEKHVEFVLDEKELRRIVISKAAPGSRVFLCDMCDLFHHKISDTFRDAVLATCARRPDLTFLVLTKRPGWMLEYLSDNRRHDILCMYAHLGGDAESHPIVYNAGWPFPNIFFGISAEDQERLEERVKPLMGLAEAGWKTFLSLEPLLGPVDLYKAYGYGKSLQKIDWVIVGGQTGPGAEPMHPDWVRTIRDQCGDANVPFFFKHWGEWLPGDQVLDGPNWRDYANEIIALPVPHRITTNGADVTELAGLWDEPDAQVYRIGRKRAGRMLDGKEHDDASTPIGDEHR
jgi:protein gp37